MGAMQENLVRSGEFGTSDPSRHSQLVFFETCHYLPGHTHNASIANKVGDGATKVECMPCTPHGQHELS